MRILGVEYIDLYMIHSPIGDHERLKLAWETLEAMYDEGKIKALGVSNYNIDELETLIGYARIKPMVLQNKFDIYTQGSQSMGDRSILEYCKKHNIIMTAYSPFNKFPFEMSALQDRHVKSVAKEVSRTPAQVLIRWTLQVGVSPLPRSSNAEHIAENLRVTNFVLSEAQMQRITGIIHLSQWNNPAWVADVYGVQRRSQHESKVTGEQHPEL